MALVLCAAEICGTCWPKFKPFWDKIVADKALYQADYDNLQAKVDQWSKACSDGFATSPSFLLVAAAALSMTVFTMRNPLE
jgi:hypothetical protein